MEHTYEPSVKLCLPHRLWHGMWLRSCAVLHSACAALLTAAVPWLPHPQVGNSVDDIKDSTNKINSHMRQLDQRMVDMHNMVGHSSTGIMLLCHVLGEITSSMGKQNSRAVQVSAGHTLGHTAHCAVGRRSAGGRR